MEIRFKRFKRTKEIKAWLLSLDASVRQTILNDLDAYEMEGVLPNTAGFLKGCDGVGEIRFNFGPGYRIYFCRYGDVVLLLLTGGVKDTQKEDIKAAQAIKDRELQKDKFQRGQ